MEYSYDQLRKMRASELREIAKGIEHDAVHGYSTMHKEHLVKAICEALGLDCHEHHEVVGVDKKSIKQKIRELKKERDVALNANDSNELKRLRREIHHLKNKLRRATV